MIILLGATSYAGQAFARAMRARRLAFIPLSQSAFDYSRFELLFDYVRTIKPGFLINAADCAERNGELADGTARMEMLQTNAILPQTVARVCGMTNTPWGHVSSGSVYSGAKVRDGGRVRIEADLRPADIRKGFASNPERFCGFSELDEPNHSFRFAPCSFYSGTKALAEEAIRDQEQTFIWRLRLPFSERDDPENYLSQLRTAPTIDDGLNSLSHLDDCVGACLQLWEQRAPFGIYNLVNPGAVSTTEVVQLIQRFLRPAQRLQVLTYDAQRSVGQRIEPPSGCILDSGKLRQQGIELRAAKDALVGCLERWQPLAHPNLWHFG